jgi:acetyl-CoA carboxylase biotin carboxyl carrier protein
MDREKQLSWLERIEEIAAVLEGSTVGELTLTEGATEITIRRNPGMVMTSVPTEIAFTGQPSAAGNRAAKAADKSLTIVAPLTGVYYSTASPSTPALVNVGDVIHVGQVVALIEAMKVFNEINAEISGRVVSLVPTNGAVVQKGDVLLRVEPL